MWWSECKTETRKFKQSLHLQTSASKECSSAQEVERLTVCIPVSATVSFTSMALWECDWMFAGGGRGGLVLVGSHTSVTAPGLHMQLTTTVWMNSHSNAERFCYPGNTSIQSKSTDTLCICFTFSPGLWPASWTAEMHLRGQKTGSATSPRNNIAPARTRRKYFK